MRTRPFPLVAATLVALAALAAPPAEAATRSYSGTFLVGEPVGVFALDACGERSLEGVNSNCVRLSPLDAHLPYALQAEADLGAILETTACFYQGKTWLGCDLAVVPADADRVAIATLGGVGVRWTLDVL